MKKKILPAIMAVTLAMTINVPVYATPNEAELTENQQRYLELTEKLNSLNESVIKLNSEIEPLIEKIEINEAEMDNIQLEVENTEKEIQSAEEDIEKTEELLSKRVRELYKSGGQSSYLMLLFSAESFNDLIIKLESTTRLVNIDKEIVDELDEKQEALDSKVKSLEVRESELIEINDETQLALEQLESKKNEQEELAELAKVEQEKFDAEFLAVEERATIQAQISAIESQSSISSLQSAVSQLENIINGQLKSPTVIEEAQNYISIAENKIEELRAQADAESAPNRGDYGTTGNAIVDYAYQFIGTPYLWGGTTPAGFDCSGFTSYVYRHAAGIEISRTTYTQINQGIPVSYNQLQPGDLVFAYGLGHVGIYVGGGQYIHAPSSGDYIKVSAVHGFYGARRIIY